MNTLLRKPAIINKSFTSINLEKFYCTKVLKYNFFYEKK